MLLIGLLLVAVRWWRQDPLKSTLTGMLTMGAASNWLDRWQSGAVIDYLIVPGWGSCNIADGLIVAGAVLLIWHIYTYHRV